MTPHGFSYEYFANIKDEEDLGNALVEKVFDYRNYIIASGRLMAWRTLFYTCYQEYASRANNYHSGSKGQYSHTNDNEFKSILDRRRAMLTATRVSWDPVAAQSTVKARAQTEIAKMVLTYYLKTKHLENEMDTTLMWGDLLGECVLAPTWDAHGGQPVETVIDPQTGRPRMVFEGDLKFGVYDPTRVIRDAHVKGFNHCDWVILEGRGNKFNEAAKYPDMAEAILGKQTPTQDEVQYHFLSPQTSYKSDEIAVYYFYHKRTPACPAGRYVKFYDGGLVAVAVDLPYADIPICRYAPEEQLETPFGYCDAYLLAGIQETNNMAYDSMVTNIELFGVQSVYGIRGTNLQWEQLTAGATLIEGSPFPGTSDGAPRPLNLLQIPPELPNFITMNIATMERLSGINATVRGQPPEGITAGVAMAFQQATAVQANAPGQARVTQFYEAVGTSMLNTLKTFASTPRMIQIAGENNRSKIKEFSATDLEEVEHVFVQLGNPILDNHSGRLAIGQDMVQNGLITTKEEYLTLIRTGDLDILTRTAVDELSLIHEENDQLMKGEDVQGMPTDNHDLHAREHAGVGALPDVRHNPALYQKVLAHVNYHLQMQGKPPLQMNPTPPAPPLEPGAPVPPPPGVGQHPGQPGAPPGAPTQGTPAPSPGQPAAPAPQPGPPNQTPPGAHQQPRARAPHSGHPANLVHTAPRAGSSKQPALWLNPQAQAVEESVTGVSPLPQSPLLHPRK